MMLEIGEEVFPKAEEFIHYLRQRYDYSVVYHRLFILNIASSEEGLALVGIFNKDFIQLNTFYSPIKGLEPVAELMKQNEAINYIKLEE